MTPFWLSALLDLAPEEHEGAASFWRDITGYHLSAPRGTHGQFSTLVPPDGDDYLRVQRLREGPSRIHLDLHVEDVAAWAERASALGATVLARPGHVVLRSPGGLLLCLVTHLASVRPAPATWPDRTRSQVDQVCLDIPQAAYSAECAFWRDLTGWPLAETTSPEFRRINPPGGLPLRLLLQRLDEPDGPVRAHLDLAASDRAAEVARHEALGAKVAYEGRGWITMTPPAGPVYCITDRPPA